MIDFGIYRDGRLFATVPVRNVQFSKTRKGPADASCLLPIPLERAARWVGSGGLSEVRITAPWGEDIWRGRIEDIGAATGGTTVQAFGYARALADVPYTGLWSVTGVDDWRDVRADEVATALPERWRMDRNGRLFIAPQKGEAFANNSNAGGQTYAIPHNSARTITNVAFSYSFTAPTNWKGVLNSYTDAWGSGATDWELVGNGANQSGAASITLASPRARIGFFMFNSTGGSVTKSTDTGVDFLEITNIRIKTTTAATVRASAIAAALRAHTHTTNSNQLINSDALIEATSTDLLNAVYEDVYPSSILDNLAGITHDWGVDGKQFYFRERTVRRTWTIEAGRINLPHSLGNVANSAYVVFRDANNRKLRTVSSSSQTGIDAFGLTRRVVLDNDTTSEAAALAARDGFLTAKEGESIVADIETLRILSSSGRRAKAWEIEPGDRIRVQNAPQYSQFNEAFGFVVNRMKYNHETGSLKLEPDMPTPTVANMLAGAVSGRGAATSGGGTSASAADFVLDTVFYVEDYNSDIQAALNAANTAGGGTVALRSRGTYALSLASGPALTVGSNVTLEGFGATIQVPATNAGDVIRIDAATRAVIRNVAIERTGTPGSALVIQGVSVRNGSSNILLENVYVDGCQRGFQIGVDGTAACEDVTLRGCVATHTTAATANSSTFGLCVDNATSVLVDGGLYTRHWLDGIKLRTLSRNVKLVNVKSNNNGVSFESALNGNGIDAYYGGEQFQVIGGEYSYNGGSGILIKTGVQNESGGGGPPLNNITIVGPTCEFNRGGAGLELNRNAATSTTEPLVCQTTVSGGQYNSNGHIGATGASADVGIYIRGRNVSLNGVSCKRNERQGILIAPEAFNVTVSNPIIVSNGRKTANTFPGMDIAGKSITVWGGIYDGRDGDFIAQESDLSSETAYHNFGILVNTNADQIRVFEPLIKNSGVGTGLSVLATTGTIVIYRSESSVNPEGARFGGPGSKFTRTDTGDMWVKHTGYGITGWVRVFPYYQMYSRTVAQLPTASTLTGAIAFASNGRKTGEGAGAGTGIMVFSDGTNWIASDSGATVTV